MNAQQQIPRNALVWMIISLFTLAAPHVTRLPVWVLAVYGVAALWRSMVYRGRWSFPGRLVKLALILCACGGIYASYGNMLGLEPTVALLLTAFALKLIELAGRKDAYVLLFLGYFICITEFLFSQDLLIVLYSVLNTTLITTALVALHQPDQHRFNHGSLRLAAVMLAQAFPLMLVLFFLFPRIGPLWSVPIKRHTAKTGVSDVMQPGDISHLSQSDEVAFRAQFQGEIPPRSQLYWRGLVFSRLADGAWRRLRNYEVAPNERRPAPVTTGGEPLRYSVILNPTQQHWLYSLRYAESGQAGVMATADYLLYSPVELEDQYRYHARSWPDAVLEPELSDWRRRTELQLPKGGNPRTRQLALDMRAASASAAAFVGAVLAMFTHQPFVYTLQPPRLGTDPMDRFLFQTRRGFCEHYAYAFVVMMRAAGVPARVVAGYQGGEVNPVNRTVIVHQFDAHAWAEIWLRGRGWVRVDPTAAVAPERIELGLEQAVATEGSFLADSPLSPLRYRGISWLNSLRLRYDALTYQWQSWVVGFNSERQYRVLQKLFGQLDASKLMLILLGSGALVLVPVAGSLLARRRVHPLSPLDHTYLTFCDRLSRLGVVRNPGEGPAAFAERAAQALPHWAPLLQRLTGIYCELAYADANLSPTRSTQLKREFKRGLRRLKRARRPR
ncbi:transglutaminase TgpA family protein [Nitrococcus mobilis]|uniref:Transglutaminase-like domain-containing protein n=1 Tax=Nitrococcus mobilis Nb-231 TaxID=314278 RepID=A4BPL9_9GAMM|nr:DUF3488 and transglutaminase-like domain-containing protein [Nitrococcus mobilis]EAR22520.1 hypothetical protein NB231_12309 [Nitrococcus mobilis Nb-231]